MPRLSASCPSSSPRPWLPGGGAGARGHGPVGAGRCSRAQVLQVPAVPVPSSQQQLQPRSCPGSLSHAGTPGPHRSRYPRASTPAAPGPAATRFPDAHRSRSPAPPRLAAPTHASAPSGRPCACAALGAVRSAPRGAGTRWEPPQPVSDGAASGPRPPPRPLLWPPGESEPRASSFLGTPTRSRWARLLRLVPVPVGLCPPAPPPSPRPAPPCPQGEAGPCRRRPPGPRRGARAAPVAVAITTPVGTEAAVPLRSQILQEGRSCLPFTARSLLAKEGGWGKVFLPQCWPYGHGWHCSHCRFGITAPRRSHVPHLLALH